MIFKPLYKYRRYNAYHFLPENVWVLGETLRLYFLVHLEMLGLWETRTQDLLQRSKSMPSFGNRIFLWQLMLMLSGIESCAGLTMQRSLRMHERKINKKVSHKKKY